MVEPLVMFRKVERFRRHGLDVMTAVDLTAEQCGADDEMLAVAHFKWLLDDAATLAASAQDGEPIG